MTGKAPEPQGRSDESNSPHVEPPQDDQQPAFDLSDYVEPGEGDAGLRPTAELPEEDTQNLDEQLAQLVFDDHELDHRLKAFLGPAVTVLVVGQVLVMNLAFMLYIAICFALKEAPNNAVVIAYLTTSSAEVIGLALVVTRYLFPEKGPKWNGS